MHLRIGRLIFTAVGIEALTVLSLVLIMALFGPSDPAAAPAYAERLGNWVGPITGFALCVLGGFWVARGLPSSQVLNGFLLGCLVAGIDVALLILLDAEFQLVHVLSNAGRVMAGTLGGMLAARSGSKDAGR